MHKLRRANNRIDRTGLDAFRATDAFFFDDDGN